MSKIKLKRGDDETFLVRLNETINGTATPLNLDNIARIDLHAQTEGGVVLQLSTTDGSITRTPEGLVLLHIAHRKTENARWYNAEYDLQVTFADGTRKTPLSGMIELRHDITRID